MDYSGVAANTGRILKCPLTGCANPTVIYSRSDEVSMDELHVDDGFVYFHGSYCKYADGVNWYDGCAFIAAIPK